ncbi:Clavaminate synthase-like protein [Lophiostoma macrostomum CBS 122681]|uniref:Clavaminate synthase-like protein n=1 Tax=Lophiostoma macrostomum CBS 122681 TaxID=1314788 RepID=A0A6A6TCA0_9PLEO|nr:Clavaminate synthase-like protein [Lophiostoma macrostomum CBS 122681]
MPPSPSPSPSPPTTFLTLPILPLSHALSPSTKPAFLSALRSALLNVGFLYLSETGLPEQLIGDVVAECRAFFEDLPDEEKSRIEMKEQRSFLGWSRLDNETTAFNPDHREQLDLSTPHPVPGPDAPLYHNLLAPNQWPSPAHLPSFRPVYEDYMRRMSQISRLFTSLIAEAIGLPATAFDKFFDQDQQHKLKIVKYPEIDIADLPDGASEMDRKKYEIKRQGVGPHKDSMLTSYLLQASNQLGLQAQNARGEWVDCKPIDGTLVVAIGQGMEALTDGVCASTTHRVLSPKKGEGARYSVPFFQGVSYDAKFEAMDVPEDVLKLRDEARKARKDDVEFTFVKGRWGHLGEATLMNRVKSHPDVGERWYPDLLAQIRAQQAAAAVKAS